MVKTSSLLVEAAPRCTRCGRERIVKNGKNACGRQQFRRRACRVMHPKDRPAAPEPQREVLRAVAIERLSLRAAARVFGGERNTITDWRRRKRAACRP